MTDLITAYLLKQENERLEKINAELLTACKLASSTIGTLHIWADNTCRLSANQSNLSIDLVNEVLDKAIKNAEDENGL